MIEKCTFDDEKICTAVVKNCGACPVTGRKINTTKTIGIENNVVMSGTR